MKQIVAIGGTNETNELGLEKYILSLTGKTNPKVCLLMQASAEDSKYIAIFYDRFLSLGATPSNVSLFGVVKDGWKEKLLSADVIYVGGGNTKSLMALWRDWGVDKVLKQAYENGTIMCGSSAGGICWFEQGCTDSIWPLGVVNALGFLNGSFCPHLDTEKERDGRYTTLVNNQA